MTAYSDFLVRKVAREIVTGLDAERIPALPSHLFDFQRDIVRWLLRRGRGALFAGTGLGKSLMELAWADAVARALGVPALILTPLAVAPQFVTEGEKFGIRVNYARRQADVAPGITVTNYEKMEHFDLHRFGAVVLDESSILKAYDGKTRTELIARCQSVPFRLAATATPAPNDYMELGNHAEFHGVMSYTDMLSTFFTHDSEQTKNWRLRGHAEDAFWRWMCTWAIALRRPSDLGYADDKFELPPLHQHEHLVAVPYTNSQASGFLFAFEAQTLQERLAARRESIGPRIAKAVEITPKDRPFVWWCNLNAESEGLARTIPGAVEVRGSDPDYDKERKLADFAKGRIRVLVTKPSICGFGLNWQHCADTGFVGLNDSFEQVYQSVRRFWRFGQTKPVHAHFIAAETEGAVLSNIRRKEAASEAMIASMVRHMADLNTAMLRGARRETTPYTANQNVQVPTWIERAVS